MGFSRKEDWSGLPVPSPGDLPNPGIEPGSPALQVDALTTEVPGKPYICVYGLKLNIQRMKIMASGPITSWKIDGETVTAFIFLGTKITAGGDCTHETK